MGMEALNGNFGPIFIIGLGAIAGHIFEYFCGFGPLLLGTLVVGNGRFDDRSGTFIRADLAILDVPVD